MAKQTFTSGQVLTAAEMNSLQENDYNWTVTTKTASYTLAAGDEGTRVVMNNAGATTITVDDAVFAAGDVVWLHNIGAGTCTITAGTATVNTDGSLALEQYQGGQLFFTSASAAIFFPNVGAQAGGKILQVVSTFIDGTFSTASTSFVDITGHTATITPSSASNKVLVLYTTHVGPAAGRVSPLNLVRDGSTIAQPTGSPTYPGTAQTYATGEIFNVNFNYLDSPASATAVVYKIQTKTDAGTNYINRNVSGVIAATSSLTLLEVSA